jgi:hypothetical protein
MQVQTLLQLQTMVRQTLEHQLQQMETEEAMQAFLEAHRGRELEVTIDIRMEPKRTSSSHWRPFTNRARRSERSPRRSMS